MNLPIDAMLVVVVFDDDEEDDVDDDFPSSECLFARSAVLRCVNNDVHRKSSPPYALLSCWHISSLMEQSYEVDVHRDRRPFGWKQKNGEDEKKMNKQKYC